jgi:hypothetical protein
MQVIEALRARVEEPHDHLHISHVRMSRLDDISTRRPASSVLRHKQALGRLFGG